MTLEPHPSPPLDVQDKAIPVIARRYHRLGARLGRELKERAAVQLLQPGQSLPHVVRMDPATRDPRHVRCFPGQDGRPREVAEIGIGGRGENVSLPA